MPTTVSSRHVTGGAEWGHALGRRAAALRERLACIGRVVRRIIGAPDYEAYMAHHAAHHPGCAPMTRDEFVASRLSDRYSRPGQRCC